MPDIEAKQESETQGRGKWSWVESQIWTERMLTALDNGVKGNKWFSLWDKVKRIDTLTIAWTQVKKNKGTSGVDKVSIERFDLNPMRYLEELTEELHNGSYQPQAIKRVYIPKGDGKRRPLGIPSVKDRIVQTALLKVIEPIFENEFLDMSYGFRPQRGAKDALREVDALLKEGHIWVVDADIEGYFDNISQSNLMSLVENHICDSKVLQLLKGYLNQPIMEGLKSYTPDKGTPQGAVISPLLANIYLHPLDKLITESGYKMVRYADDFVILCKTREAAIKALNQVRQWTQSKELTLHPEKTHVGNCTEKGQGFEFLGYRFEAGNRLVRKKSMMKFRDNIRMKTRRSRGDNISLIIADLNHTLKGWFEYFKHACKSTFRSVDGFVRRRLRSLLRRQNKRSNGTGKNVTDHSRWPNMFFASHGLFTTEQAHRQARQSR